MEEKIISCEISFVPIQSQNYTKEVDEVIRLIAESGLEHQVGIFSTTIRGTKEKVFTLIKKIFDEMELQKKVLIILKISNLCGC
ncbi:MAG: YkoF family thiamine/hydroxymethylpyrimidine-binding protein [Candidatus Kapaibacteriales bacterium]